ncbi:MAG: ComEC/Rec2 family competence protein, partial [Myxococcales bacterium]|nr:ComEC/Rec2 family competence protein [Myxococcales bacterium]
ANASEGAKPPWRLLRATARILIATLPIALWCFDEVTWVGLVTNLLFVPIASILIIPLALLHAATTLWPAVAPVSGTLLTLTTDGFVLLAEFFSQVPPLRLAPPSPLQGLLVASLSAITLVRGRARWRILAALTCLFAFGVEEIRLRHHGAGGGEFRATFLDVGQGDSTLVDFADGRSLLIDTGGSPGGGADPGQRVLLPLLRARRRHRIDVVLITHAHPDHYGGLRSILGEVDIGEIWINGQALIEDPGGEFVRLLLRASEQGALVRSAPALCGDRRIGRNAVSIFAPCPRYDPGLDPNDNSLLLAIEQGSTRFLFMGDAERSTEASLTKGPFPLRATVLKVGHHGSKTSSTSAFVDAVRPTWAVVSSGRHNPYGHPSPVVSQTLRDAGATLLRTDQQGGIEIRVHPSGPAVTTTLATGR